jgi:DNA-binding MarR family transcriptional regulator
MAGYARRVRDTNDRRRIYVDATEQAKRNGSRFYAEHATLAERLYQRYTEEQIELLLEFVRQGREFNERKASELEAALKRSDQSADR